MSPAWQCGSSAATISMFSRAVSQWGLGVRTSRQAMTRVEEKATAAARVRTAGKRASPSAPEGQ